MEKSTKHTCDYGEGKCWHTYEYLENRMMEASRYVAIDPLNQETWGEELASIFILTGNAIDTFFRNMITCPCILNDQKYKDYKKKPKKKRNWNITHFRTIFESIYELSTNKVRTPFGLGKSQEFTPFQNLQSSESPDWWNDYTSLKHDYYENLSMANQNNVLNALGALLILNALHMCIKSFLIDIMMIEKIPSGPEYEIVPPERILARDGFKRYFMWSKIGTTPWAGEAALVTPLFIFEYKMDREAKIGPWSH